VSVKIRRRTFFFSVGKLKAWRFFYLLCFLLLLRIRQPSSKWRDLLTIYENGISFQCFLWHRFNFIFPIFRSLFLPSSLLLKKDLRISISRHNSIKQDMYVSQIIRYLLTLRRFRSIGYCYRIDDVYKKWRMP
jgi:hypothetical protein